MNFPLARLCSIRLNNYLGILHHYFLTKFWLYFTMQWCWWFTILIWVKLGKKVAVFSWCFFQQKIIIHILLIIKAQFDFEKKNFLNTNRNTNRKAATFWNSFCPFWFWVLCCDIVYTQQKWRWYVALPPIVKIDGTNLIYALMNKPYFKALNWVGWVHVITVGYI